MKKIILIGASTGGPGHLKKIISSIDENTQTSFIIVQHMTKSLIPSFTNQLRDVSKISVYSSEDSSIVEDSSIFICAQNCELKLNHNMLSLEHTQKSSIYSPSIELLFNSALNIKNKYKIISIILTGIGDDGALSSFELYKSGAYCIAESSQSAIVYGMPKQAYNHNNNITVMSLNEILEFIKHV